jgi:hypothetical protein
MVERAPEKSLVVLGVLGFIGKVRILVKARQIVPILLENACILIGMK